MTPAELGLPEAPWYGARKIGGGEDGDIYWNIGTALDNLDLIFAVRECGSPFYLAAIGTCITGRPLDIIGGPVTVKARVEFEVVK